MRRLTLAAVATLVVAESAATGQNRLAAPDAAFEVVSVKPNVDVGAPEGLALQPDGSARFTAFPVRTLITIAYRAEGIQRFDQLVGAPSWIATERFDVAGKTGSGSRADPGQLPAMMRSLLRERFALRVHTETRRMPTYALVKARRDGRLGPNLRESTVDCARAADVAANGGTDARCGIRAAGGLVTGRAVSTALLAGNLSGYPTVDRYVADRTGLTGRYDFTLEYSPAFVDPGSATPATGPSLFTALTEQLGLRLQPERAMLPVLVIDHIDRPTPD